MLGAEGPLSQGLPDDRTCSGGTLSFHSHKGNVVMTGYWRCSAVHLIPGGPAAVPQMVDAQQEGVAEAGTPVLTSITWTVATGPPRSVT